MKKLLTILTWALVTTASAQTFKGEATLPTVQADGFYRISIPPSLGPHVNRDFTNLRIYDAQNKEVPYLFQQEAPNYYSEVFKEYEIVEKKQEKNCCTRLILRNPDSHPINNISLSIKNAEVTKQATLLGSDDKQNWFALKQNFLLNAINNPNKTSEIRIVDFPLSNYTYYLLQIEDSTTAPLNILSAGYYQANSEEGKFTEITGFKVTKTDRTNKTSHIKILFDTTQVIDKLSVSMTGSPYFLRRAHLSEKKMRYTRKREKEFYYDRLYDLEISSKQPSIVDLSVLQTKDLLIEIDNQDNPSLDVASIKAYQLNRYLTAWLKKDQTYTIKIGDTKLEEPSYDIGYFKDSIPNQPPLLSMGTITLFEQKEAESPTFFTNRTYIWIAIVIVIVVLGFMTLKMVGETEKKNS